MRRLRLLILIALVAGAAIAPEGAAARPWPLGPLVNADFSVPAPALMERDESLMHQAVDAVGSALPGATERDLASGGAFGWSHRVLAGQDLPYGSVEWVEGGLLRVHVDPRDSGPETAVLTQPTGQRGRLALYETPFFVDVHVERVRGAPVTVRALAALEPGHELKASTSAVLEPSDLPRVVRLQFEGPPFGSMSQFYLALSTDLWGGASVDLDEVDLRGAPPLPAR